MTGMIRRWLARLFTPGQKAGPRGRPANWPTIEEMARLPPFDGLKLRDIIEVATPQDAQRACRELLAEGAVGFDTESKPTFRKGEVSTGPHIAQFATLDRAYVFMLHEPACREAVARLMASETLRKIGFGLSSDIRQVSEKLRVEPRQVLDLESLFAERGYGRGVGTKVGVALALRRRFSKSRVKTSNWMLRRLSDAQILYAANDAFAAIRVFHTLTSA